MTSSTFQTVVPPTEVTLGSTKWMAVFGFGIIFVLGLIFNIMSIIVLRCASFRKSSISFSLTALSCIYIILLICGCFRQWLLYVTPSQVDIRSAQGFCQVGIFGTYFLGHMASWTLSLIVLERVFIVWFPFVARAVCSKKRIKIVWSIMTLTLVCINFFLLLAFDYDYLKENPVDYENLTYIGEVRPQHPSATDSSDKPAEIIESKICYVKPRFDYFYNYVWPQIDILLLTVIPFVVLFSGNTAILVAIFRANGFRKRASNFQTNAVNKNNRYNNNNSSTENVGACHKFGRRLSNEEKNPASNPSSATLMLLGLSFVHLLLTLPSGIYFAVVDGLFRLYDSPEFAGRMELFFVASMLLFYLNDSVNFFVYYITGSKFRETFKARFTWRESKSSRVEKLTASNGNLLSAKKNHLQTQIKSKKHDTDRLNIPFIVATCNVVPD
ncbi:hypothetical protein HELRODRAFT_178905 [Helobdella robusta]|uniref:G-protein coupled receptors family 1 profile domain-containing protein n=1 Tax=Helobdella robusta TaxID=6412 RepID=T1FDV8_HELRO|nr:hypothetical protein HELRODRAFT_178905 [Helobdella robusta]ESN95984.1 hypothetical protein HELRODRAFT_178905 [Helobdella robusta]